MPTVMRIGSYRFFFYSNEGTEPMHIHIEKDHATAKVWLKPIELASSHGFSSVELSKIIHMVKEHQQKIIGAWHAFFKI